MIRFQYILACALAVCLGAVNCQGALYFQESEGLGQFEVSSDLGAYIQPRDVRSVSIAESPVSRSSQNSSPVYFPGDANLDLSVSFPDLGILLNGYSQAGTWTAGDFDGNQVVEFSDLGLLLNNYGTSYDSTFGSSPVPELSSIFVWLTMCGAVAMWYMRGRLLVLAKLD